jgi:hypothetical protein
LIIGSRSLRFSGPTKGWVIKRKAKKIVKKLSGERREKKKRKSFEYEVQYMGCCSFRVSVCPT